MTYRYISRVPTPSEHRALAESVGWGEAFVWEAMPASLQNSVCGVVACHDDAVVGMGRVIGDGAFYYYVQDVAVRPEHQGRGVGDAMVRKLLQQVRRVAPQHAFVGLFGTPEAVGLYQRFGFAQHDTMSGMFLVLDQGEPAQP